MTDVELRVAHLYVITNSTATKAYHRQAGFYMLFEFIELPICIQF